MFSLGFGSLDMLTLNFECSVNVVFDSWVLIAGFRTLGVLDIDSWSLEY